MRINRRAMLLGASSLVLAGLSARVEGAGGKLQTSGIVRTGGPAEFGFNRSLAGRYRIGMFGTSIGAASIGTLQKFEEDVRGQRGDAGSRVVLFGGIGGSFTNLFLDSWHRQPFGGPSFVRLRGDARATPITRNVFGDQIEYFYSQEADSAAHLINVDGVDYEVGGPDDQKYGLKKTINVALGPHLVTVNPPTSSGFVYPERLIARNTGAVGIEVEDFTYLGSALYHATKLQKESGDQVAGVPIKGDVGIRSHYGVPDLDLAIVTFTVNDSGMDGGSEGGWVRSGGFAAAVGKLLDGFRAQGVPVIYLVEMAGHYIMSMEGGNSNRFRAYNEAKQAIMGQGGDGVFVLDWDAANRNDSDLDAYASAYYPKVSEMNSVEGTYKGDFIHPNQAGHRAADDLLSALTGVPVPHDSTSDKEWAARVRAFPDSVQGERAVTIDGAPKTLPAMAAAVQALSESLKDASRLVPVFVDATASITPKAAEQRAALATSANADDFGKYVDLSNFTLSGFEGGSHYWVTMKVGGAAQVRANGEAIRVRIDGQPMPYTDLASLRTNISGPSLVAGEDAPYIVAAQVRANAAGQIVVLSGRLYDIAVTRSDYPVLLAAP